jgi:hypothetical protein
LVTVRPGDVPEMTESCRGEIIGKDGRVTPIERRSVPRNQPVYQKSAGSTRATAVGDRRQRRRLPDEVLRGRLIDISS